MHRTLRRGLVSALAVAMLGSMLAPAAALAAGPRHAPRISVMRWAPNGVSRTVRQGLHRELPMVARFRTTSTVRNAVFSLSFSSGIVARPSRIYWGTIWPNAWNDLSFTVVVPSYLRSGWYAGTARLLRQGREDFDRLGVPFTIAIHVVRHVTPPPPPPVITWSPSNNLGTIHLRQGQAVTETASFVSRVALTNVQAQFALPSLASSNGLTTALVSPLPATVAAGVAVPLTFTVSAAPTATVRGYLDDLHLLGSQNGGAAVRLWQDLDFGVDVDSVLPPPSVAPFITWIPSQHLGTFNVQRGQTITSTATFTSNVALTNMAVNRTLSNFGQDHGVAVTVVSTSPATTSIAANTPVSVTFTIAAGPAAKIGIYHRADLHVDASTPGNPAVTNLRNDADFQVNVQAAPITNGVISWSAPHNNLGTIAVLRGQTVTESVSFSSTVALSNLSVQRTLSEFAQNNGLQVKVLSLSPASSSLAANAPATVTFSVSADPHAKTMGYPADLHVDASQGGSSQISLQTNVLTFTVVVNR